MPYYRCTVADNYGKKTTLYRDSGSEDELRMALSISGQFLLSVRIIDRNRINKIKRRFSKTCILEFTEIMANLLRSGLTLKDALELCGVVTTTVDVSVLSKILLEGMKQGFPFHEVLAIHSSSFSALYQSLMRLGEKTGSVAGVFTRMESYLKSEKKIRSKTGNVLWYPALILMVVLGICMGIIFYVMPKMMEIFSAFSVDGNDYAGLELQNVYSSLWIMFSLLLFISITGVTLFTAYKISDRVARIIDNILLQLPFLGAFLKSIQSYDFSFAMEMLTGAGITIGNALRESATVVSNRAYSNALLNVYERLLKGEKLSSSFLEHRAFPLYIGTWIAVGEQTGTVEHIFTQIRSFFQNNVEIASERLMNIIEPALTLLVGIIVLVMIIQFVLPIFSLYGRIL